MLKTITNLLRGEVTGRVESGFPERVINICAEYGIQFWDLRWESGVSFTFTMNRRDWKRLRRLSRRLDCDMTAVSWRGTPFFLGRMRHRYGLWITLGTCMTLLFYGSFFIWDFDIEGNETVSRQEILRALESSGVAFGSFGYGINSFQLRNELLLKLPRLSYIAINVRGCRAYVQVRERIEPPEIISRQIAGNTIAEKDALVTAIQPWDGEKQVLPGTTVAEGQLLISGVVENDYGGTRFLRGMGEVYGRTWYSLGCKVPLTVMKKDEVLQTEHGFNVLPTNADGIEGITKTVLNNDWVRFNVYPEYLFDSTLLAEIKYFVLVFSNVQCNEAENSVFYLDNIFHRIFRKLRCFVL